LVDGVAAQARGARERAHDLFDAYLPLARYEQQAGVGLAVRKFLFKERGVIASDFIRKPGPKLSPRDVDDIRFLVRRQDQRLRALA
jgi:4-hydroxy-tetrahydrodipicolinate synthase